MSNTRARTSFGTAKDALRRWWFVVLCTGLVGALAGLLSLAGAQPSATATLVLQLDGMDAANLSRQAQSALIQVSRSEVFDKAGGKLSMDPAELRRSITMASSGEAMNITVTGRASDADRAIKLANTVAEVAVETSLADVDAQLKDLEETTTKLVQAKALSDATAERVRISRLGEGLADNQTKIVALANRIRLQELATGATVKAASRPMAALTGLAGGVLLGALGVILLGGRRGRVRREAEVERLFPDALVTSPADIHEASQDPAWPVRRVVLATNAGAVLARRLSEKLGQGDDGRPRLDISVARPNGPVYQRALEDPWSLVVFPVIMRKTRIEDVDHQLRHVGAQPRLLLIEESLADTDRRGHEIEPEAD